MIRPLSPRYSFSPLTRFLTFFSFSFNFSVYVFPYFWFFFLSLLMYSFCLSVFLLFSPSHVSTLSLCFLYLCVPHIPDCLSLSICLYQSPLIIFLCLCVYLCFAFSIFLFLCVYLCFALYQLVIINQSSLSPFSLSFSCFSLSVYLFESLYLSLSLSHSSPSLHVCAFCSMIVLYCFY